MENDYGLIYGLTNPYLQGLVKIGVTRRKNINARIRELGTAVPVPFECAFAYKVSNDRLFGAERALHGILDDKREGREFYRIDPAKVDNLLLGLGLEPVKDDVQTEIDVEEAKRMPTMDFFDLGLHEGDTLYFVRDESITCSVATNRKVLYKGSVVSLSSFTHELLGYSVRVQPSPFWKTKDGVRLAELQNAKNAANLAAANNALEPIISAKL